MAIISRPIVAFQRAIDRTSHTSNLLFYTDDRLILITLALLLVLLIICAFLRNRMTVEDLEATFDQPLALFTTLVDQLPYLSLDNLLGIATARLLDANDARAAPRPTTTTTGGLSNPVSTAPRFWARRQQALGVNSQPAESV